MRAETRVQSQKRNYHCQEKREKLGFRKCRKKDLEKSKELSYKISFMIIDLPSSGTCSAQALNVSHKDNLLAGLKFRKGHILQNDDSSNPRTRICRRRLIARSHFPNENTLAECSNEHTYIFIERTHSCFLIERKKLARFRTQLL